MWPNNGLPAPGQTMGNDVDDAQAHVPRWKPHLLTSMRSVRSKVSAKQRRVRGMQVHGYDGYAYMQT